MILPPHLQLLFLAQHSRGMANKVRSILLINPNSSEATTAQMVSLAQERSGGVEVIGATTVGGPDIITNETALDASVEGVLAHKVPPGCIGVVIAAFGDPALVQMAERLEVPVVGIAQAGLLAGGADGRQFSVATTTPELADRIRSYAHSLGLKDNLISIELTRGDPFDVMGDPERLQDELFKACERCVESGAEAIVIGGGPLARTARALSHLLPAPIIEPVPEATELVLNLARKRGLLG
jgi:Asp/Glu/hydantoin racemase